MRAHISTPASPLPHSIYVYLLGNDCSQAVTAAHWTAHTTSADPPGRASAGADALANYLYMFGGDEMVNRYTINDTSSAALYRYVRRA